jgi:hypothetical protein
LLLQLQLRGFQPFAIRLSVEALQGVRPHCTPAKFA